jgi:hypothetical protein
MMPWLYTDAPFWSGRGSASLRQAARTAVFRDAGNCATVQARGEDRCFQGRGELRNLLSFRGAVALRAQPPRTRTRTPASNG